jgi:hypothetical protein
MRKFFILGIGFFLCLMSYSQDTQQSKKQDTLKPQKNTDTTDVSKLLEEQLKEDQKNKTQYVAATFKTTRLIDGHSVENTAKGVLDFKISHRFGPFSSGSSQFFGLDFAKMRLGLDYGVTNQLTIGVGRNSDLQVFDGFLKWKILRQSTGKQKMPVTLNYIPMIAVQARKDLSLSARFSNRLTFVQQVLIGRKFNEDLSLQIMPTMVHRNFPQDQGPNDVYAIGIGGRQKLSKRTSFNVEYYYQLPGSRVPDSKNEISLGFDIETGGHVFQLHVSNSMSMTESNFITGNKNPAAASPNGGMRFGFNISRVFTIGKKHNKNRFELRLIALCISGFL